MPKSTTSVFSDLLFLHEWWVPMVIIIGLTPLFHFIIHQLYKRFFPRLEKTQLIWDLALLKALVLPVKVLVWVLGVAFAIHLLAFLFNREKLIEFFNPFLSFSCVAVVAWFALRFTKNMETDYTQSRSKKRQRRYDKTTVHAICQVSRIFTVLIAILVYLQMLDINISAVLAFGGAGGLIVGLAAKDLLANFFGGLMIYLDRPFSVGDWIRSPDREIEGYVEYVGWRLTRIRTFSKRPLYVPNGLFSNISVENPSRMSNRQIKTHIALRYEDAAKVVVIQKEIEEMVRKHEDIDTGKAVIVRFDEFAPSALHLLIHCFTKTTNRADYMLTQQNIFLKAIEIIENQGAKCAFPTSTLHILDAIAIQSPNHPSHE